jgi:Thiol:disulfide interchange protein
MIPMTVSFFLKQNSDGDDTKKGRGKWLATIFGLSIIALYTIPIAVIILVTYLAGGATVTADIFNWLATHWLPNILFFLIFMIFAASFFGAFEITLPSRLVNDSDEKSRKGGLAGVFFVALTLVLVSFSCTGPIVGSVLIKSTQGQFWEPIITMLAFSVAFALPFTILAFVPSLLKKLPKSGGWLNSVKVVLGFIEVALGFKFLSVADQTYHWGLLDREVYLAIWIVVFTLLGLYLMGKIRFAYDSPVEHLSVFRLILIIIDFTFVVYMIPGMWGAPLKALSGYLPPITTQDFNLDRQQDTPPGMTYVIGEDAFPSDRKYADFLELPYGIPSFFDYEEARAYAAKVGKPLFVDFTGHGCVNCREMETRVWSDPRALKMMKRDYVVCALYADDKKTVDKSEWVTTDDGRVLKSLGKINSHFALERFNVNAQPYYAILDPVTETQKVPSRGYNLDVEAFVSFLEEGLK